MDPCSQGLLGACFSASFAKRNNLKIASFCGAVGGLIPDLDIFIRSKNDPLLFIEYHRHFTHSLAFIPIGGGIISFLLLFFFQKKISFKLLFVFSTLGLLTHGLLDSCTSYGTRLLWPFSDLRVSWNIISIVDPIFTLILFFSLIFCLIYKSKILAQIGIFLCSFYLLLGFFKFQKVETFVSNIADQRGHKIERILLNPTIGNNILWRSVYKFKDYYYVDAVYMPLFSLAKFKEGEKVAVIDKETIFPELTENSIQRNDIRRFSYFSQDFIYLHPDYEYLIGDLRYGYLPHDDKSLWGIKIDTTLNEHVVFKNLRNFEKKDYQSFWEMLNGNLN